MGITRSTAANRVKSRPTSRTLEFWLLVPVSIVIIAGIYLVLMAQSHQMQQTIPGGNGGALINLNEINASDQLQSLLDFYDNPKDRTFSALKILVFLQDRGRLDSVNDLREIRVTRSEIEQTRGLTSFKQRLEEIQEGTAPGEEVSFPPRPPADGQDLFDSAHPEKCEGPRSPRHLS